MKITVISFDYFGFDNYIVQDLQKKGFECNHIDFSKYYYKYSSFFEKVYNFFLKTITQKNLKKIKTEQYILNQLKNIGKQDAILVIRPDRISKNTHLHIKQYTNRYIAYLYDSSNRFPIKNLLNGLFDDIFTFDRDDAAKYNINFLSNYIYMNKKPFAENIITKNKIFMIASIDERIELWNLIADYCFKEKIDTEFIGVGNPKSKKVHHKIECTNENLYFDEIISKLEDANVFLDLIRDNQNGLSFRIFEAIAMNKKVITSNKSVVKYPFYNANNFLVIDKNNINSIKSFLEKPYISLDDKVYHEFTISNWNSKVFKL